MAEAKLNIDVDVSKLDKAIKKLNDLEVAAYRAIQALNELQGKMQPRVMGISDKPS